MPGKSEKDLRCTCKKKNSLVRCESCREKLLTQFPGTVKYYTRSVEKEKKVKETCLEGSVTRFSNSGTISYVPSIKMEGNLLVRPEKPYSASNSLPQLVVERRPSYIDSYDSSCASSEMDFPREEPKTSPVDSITVRPRHGDRTPITCCSEEGFELDQDVANTLIPFQNRLLKSGELAVIKEKVPKSCSATIDKVDAEVECKETTTKDSQTSCESNCIQGEQLFVPINSEVLITNRIKVQQAKCHEGMPEGSAVHINSLGSQVILNKLEPKTDFSPFCFWAKNDHFYPVSDPSAVPPNTTIIYSTKEDINKVKTYNYSAESVYCKTPSNVSMISSRSSASRTVTHDPQLKRVDYLNLEVSPHEEKAKSSRVKGSTSYNVNMDTVSSIETVSRTEEPAPQSVAEVLSPYINPLAYPEIEPKCVDVYTALTMKSTDVTKNGFHKERRETEGKKKDSRKKKTIKVKDDSEKSVYKLKVDEVNYVVKKESLQKLLSKAKPQPAGTDSECSEHHSIILRKRKGREPTTEEESDYTPRHQKGKIWDQSSAETFASVAMQLAPKNRMTDPEESEETDSHVDDRPPEQIQLDEELQVCRKDAIIQSLIPPAELEEKRTISKQLISCLTNDSVRTVVLVVLGVAYVGLGQIFCTPQSSSFFCYFDQVFHEIAVNILHLF